MFLLSIAGRVGKDAETRTIQSGDKFTTFSVAISMGKDKTGKDRPAKWVDCTITGDRGEKLCPYILKGNAIAVNGRPEAGSYEGRDGKLHVTLKCWVDTVTLLSKKEDRPANEDSGAPPASGGYDRPPASAPGRPPADLDDSIPF